MEQYRGTVIDSVYLGGGTPTALPPSLLVRLLLGVQACFSLAENAEITVEANPGTCTLPGLLALRDAGINRISLGAQSFIDSELATLGRIHSSAQTEEAVRLCREAGIDNISLDLMFSLPESSCETVSYSLSRLLSLAPTHVSCYSLTLCDRTPLQKAVETGMLVLPDEEEDRAQYHYICKTLADHGYLQYEISNFALPGKEARHNTKYWERAPYIGLGAAAHSFFDGCRYENPAALEDYFARVQSGSHPAGEAVSAQDAMAEFFFLGLRMTQKGVSRRDFQARFGMPMDVRYGATIAKLTRLGLLSDLGDRLVLSARGIDVSNSVFCEFL